MSGYKFGQVEVLSQKYNNAIGIKTKTLTVDDVVVSEPITCAKNR